MDLHTYGMYDVVRREHGRSVQRAEQLAWLKGYPPPKRSGLFLIRHEHTGSWALCDTSKVRAPEAKVCWYAGSA
jgi:hypothetical protein